ncbi:hypothetical protein KR032_002937 [Drosophila birchii]|nr:hypothetical protein KR032_002937 [Drosophila birchii]
MASKKGIGIIKAFMTFVHEWRNNHPESLGMSTPQAVDRCSVVWKVMTQQERSPYIEKAKSINQQIRGKANRQMTQMDLVRREAEERLEQMKRVIEIMVKEEVEANNLENMNLLFVSFHFFTKTASGDLYVPAEFSACQFSLKQGIMSWYTTLINPGSIDLGQASDALHHSNTTHKLPLPPNALGESNINKLYEEIHDYLTKCIGRKPLIVFTKAEDMAIVKASLNDLHVKSCHRGPQIEVYSMEYLLFYLKKQILQITGLPDDDITEIFTNSYLSTDYFQYCAHIACKYHEDIDRSQYCTKSMVQRWAYAFSNFLCDDLNIPKKPGKHIPLEENSDKDPDPGPEKDNESSREVKKITHLAGFGRGRVRGRLPTLGESNC